MLLQAVSGTPKPSPLIGATTTTTTTTTTTSIGFGPLTTTGSSISKSLNLRSPSAACSISPLALPRKSNKGFVVYASGKALSGFLFQPFDEVKRKEFLVPTTPSVSLARQKYADDCEAAINEQINVEYNVSYLYHALYAYFDRDNVALKGFAKFFKGSSDEERERAEKLMKYQNKRGGRVKLHSIMESPSEFENVEKGDALHAMELALSLEKLTNLKLLSLLSVAAKNKDVELQSFIEKEFLGEQVEAINKIAGYVTQLRMIGKGHGVWHFDQRLLHHHG